MKRQPHMSKNVSAAVARRAANLDAMRGRVHEKTSAAWSAELRVSVDAVLKYARDLGERCKRMEIARAAGGSNKRDRTAESEASSAALMAEWASRPIR
jgi:hypothetical protein